MRILIDIGHPAHVHYFKNFINIFKRKNHKVFVVARDKEVTYQLLENYGIEYYSRGKGGLGIIGKLLYLFKANKIIYNIARDVKPDIFLSFGSPYAAQVSWLLRKPHISFDDTDHSSFEHALYIPFTKCIVTPSVFLKDFGYKHVRFNAFMELCSLLPKYFIDEPEILAKAGINENEKYAIVRFVSWQASHDIGESGITLDDRIEIVKELSLYGRVIVSSEGEVPKELASFVFNAHPAHMHHFLKNASLIVSESLTMAAEAVFLGTPAICVSTAKAGTLDEEVRLGLIELYRNSNGVKDRAIELFKNYSYKETFKKKVEGILADLIDPTAFMVWFIENYPKSFQIMKENPDYQYNFK
jgi:hypothetical protein